MIYEILYGTGALGMAFRMKGSLVKQGMGHGL
jgi:hypothetical protein